MENGSSGLKFLVACVLVLVLCVSWLAPVCFAVDAGETKSALDQAERDLSGAYKAVVEASNAGADVNSMLTKLTEAGEFFSEALAAFSEGEYGSAFQRSQECSSTVRGLVDDAMRSREEAVKANNEHVMLTATGSGVGFTFLVVGAFFGWRFLKRRYTKQLLGLKPVLEENR